MNRFWLARLRRYPIAPKVCVEVLFVSEPVLIGNTEALKVCVDVLPIGEPVLVGNTAALTDNMCTLAGNAAALADNTAALAGNTCAQEVCRWYPREIVRGTWVKNVLSTSWGESHRFFGHLLFTGGSKNAILRAVPKHHHGRLLISCTLDGAK